jgi:uncharacterized protein
MIRVVFDTNVVVSAAWKRGGAEAHALDLVLARKLQLFVSAAILSEYNEVLRRPKFSRLTVDVIDGVMDLIRRHAVIITPPMRLAVSPDEADNRFLECAESAKADYLVTGNKRHFPQGWKNTAIINTRELLGIFLYPQDF